MALLDTDRARWLTQKSGLDREDIRTLHVGQHLIHLPTGRPVEVVATDETCFEVVTLDDMYRDEKRKEVRGGCRWRLLWEDAGEFGLPK